MDKDELLLLAKKQVSGIKADDLSGIAVARNVDALGQEKMVIDLTFNAPPELEESASYYG